MNQIIDCPTMDCRLSKYGSIGLDWIGNPEIYKRTPITHSAPIEGNNSTNETKTLLHTSNMLKVFVCV